ncbi:MAG: phosphodiester glycosidase family protein [Anaerolineae bacterium]
MSKVWWLVVSGWLLVGCATAVPPSQLAPIISPTHHPTTRSITPAPTSTSLSASLLPSPPAPTPLPDTGWQSLQPGLERRVITLLDEAERPYESLYLLRLEPDQFRFEIAYQPGAPKSLLEWQAATGALIVINGGFFTEANEAIGLTAVDGQASGISFVDFGGMLAITEAGPEIRWLVERPYTPGEPLQYALQSFPMLVKPGGVLGYPDEDGSPARRTVIGMDGNGRFLIILTRRSNFTLHQLSAWLVASDLGLDVALNLDGGSSSGLILANPREELLPFVLLPAVITIYPR